MEEAAAKGQLQAENELKEKFINEQNEVLEQIDNLKKEQMEYAFQVIELN